MSYTTSKTNRWEWYRNTNIAIWLFILEKILFRGQGFWLGQKVLHS